MSINLKDLAVGDIFSESSHYTLTEINGGNFDFKHHESGEIVTLSGAYVSNLLSTANSYEKEVIVNKEDTKDGEVKGIRTIWEEIHSQQVFTVVFKKQDKAKLKKVLAEEKATQRDKAIELIEKARKSKKSMATAYGEALEFIQENPISLVEEGEDRVLYGYKVQFTSRDGKYDCMDMKIGAIRPVNINTIKALIIDGVKYSVKS